MLFMYIFNYRVLIYLHYFVDALLLSIENVAYSNKEHKYSTIQYTNSSIILSYLCL